MKRTTKSVQSTAYHEAGHVVARFHIQVDLQLEPSLLNTVIDVLQRDGIFPTPENAPNLYKLLESTEQHLCAPPVEKVTIVPGEGYSGLCKGKSFLPEHLSTEEYTRSNFEGTALVLLAGPAATKKFNPRGFRTYHAATDHELVGKILEKLVLGQSDEEFKAYWRLLELRAKAFVDRSLVWEQIVAVAEALIQEETLYQKKVEDIIRKIYDRDLARTRKRRLTHKDKQ